MMRGPAARRIMLSSASPGILLPRATVVMRLLPASGGYGA